MENNFNFLKVDCYYNYYFLFINDNFFHFHYYSTIGLILIVHLNELINDVKVNYVRHPYFVFCNLYYI